MGDGLGCRPGLTVSCAPGEGIQALLEYWTSGFPGRRRGGEFRAERMLTNWVEELVLLDSNNTEGLLSLIRQPVHLIIDTFTQ